MITSKFNHLSVLIAGKRGTLFLLYILLLISTVMESFGIAAFYPIVDVLQDAQKLAYYKSKTFELFPVMESLIDGENFVGFILIGVGLLFLIKNVFLVLANYGNNRVITNLTCSWINRIFRSYLGRPYQFFVEHQAGDLVQRQLKQTQTAGGAVRELLNLLGGLTTIFVLFILICIIAPRGILALVLIMVPVYFATLYTSKGTLYRTGSNIVELEKQGFSLSTEILSGIKQVKIFGAENHFFCFLQKIWGDYAKNLILKMLVVSLPRPAIETIVVACTMAAIYLLRDVGSGGGSMMPILAVFGAALYRMLPLVSGASSQAMNVASMWPSVEVVASLLRVPEMKPTGKPLRSFQNDLVLKNVSFAYDNRKPVLVDMNMSFKKQHFYGIVGHSGSGKSTLVDLLTGFYSPQRGQVLVDGLDLKDIEIRTWLSQLGVISQEAFIFSGSIEDNICFGIELENRDLDRVKEAARIAYADEYIDSLSDGYKTLVGERGVKLSGGQRQRLAIARAIYLDPPILIFDEATSSLDALSERKVQEAIESLHGKRTVIVIAHRLATVVHADHIYVIENGRLVEQGEHESLRMKNGVYSRLCEGQLIH